MKPPRFGLVPRGTNRVSSLDLYGIVSSMAWFVAKAYIIMTEADDELAADDESLDCPREFLGGYFLLISSELANPRGGRTYGHIPVVLNWNDNK